MACRDKISRERQLTGSFLFPPAFVKRHEAARTHLESLHALEKLLRGLVSRRIRVVELAAFEKFGLGAAANRVVQEQNCQQQ